MVECVFPADRRCSSPRERAWVLGCLCLSVGLWSAVGGCGTMNPPVESPPSQAASRPDLPAYVYPDEAPVVDTYEFRRFVTRLDADSTVIWLFADCSGSSRRLAVLGAGVVPPDKTWSPIFTIPDYGSPLKDDLRCLTNAVRPAMVSIDSHEQRTSIRGSEPRRDS